MLSGQSLAPPVGEPRVEKVLRREKDVKEESQTDGDTQRGQKHIHMVEVYALYFCLEPLNG